MGTVINPQRDLMQDVGPGISVHIPALLPVPVAHTKNKVVAAVYTVSTRSM
jgi:hypothetical protein